MLEVDQRTSALRPNRRTACLETTKLGRVQVPYIYVFTFTTSLSHATLSYLFDRFNFSVFLNLQEYNGYYLSAPRFAR